MLTTGLIDESLHFDLFNLAIPTLPPFLSIDDHSGVVIEEKSLSTYQRSHICRHAGTHRMNTHKLGNCLSFVMSAHAVAFGGFQDNPGSELNLKAAFTPTRHVDQRVFMGCVFRYLNQGGVALAEKYVRRSIPLFEAIPQTGIESRSQPSVLFFQRVATLPLAIYHERLDNH